MIHPSEVERTAALANHGAARDLVIADTREQVGDLNAAIRDRRQGRTDEGGVTITTSSGEVLGIGDRVATRRNDPHLGVANRQTWTITSISHDGSLTLHGRGRDRPVPAEYAARFIQLAYATTVHGAQGETVNRAHAAIGNTTGARTRTIEDIDRYGPAVPGSPRRPGRGFPQVPPSPIRTASPGIGI